MDGVDNHGRTRGVLVALAVAALVMLAGCLCPECPTCEPTATAVATETPAPTATPEAKPACWDDRLDDIGVTLERRDGQFRLVAAWTTIDGQWDTAPACAWQWIDDGLGGERHAYGRAEDAGGNPIMTGDHFGFALTWPSGGDERQPESNGWANLILAGQGWDPNLGPGPYDFFVFGGDKIHGLGLPWNNHWSFFGVWQQVESLQEYDSRLMSEGR